MFAIVAGLSSPVLSRLHLTWAHVSRTSQFDVLAKLLEPSGNFSAYRSTLATIDGPCIPFIGMFLSDLVHTHDQHPDVILTDRGHTLVHFVKRQRWADAVHSILRHQARQYALAEEPLTAAFVETQLAGAAAKDPQYFWSRSQELHQAEMAHADIRKGLEAAGF
jgi:son of sevenless-like protein